MLTLRELKGDVLQAVALAPGPAALAVLKIAQLYGL
jgi:hypothetical protein